MKESIPRPANGLIDHSSLRVAVYCRTPLECREAHCVHYIEKVAATPEWTMAGFFFDAKSSNGKRPEFDRMLQLCRKRKIDLILTRSATMFARNTMDCLTTIRALRDLGVAVAFEREGFDTQDPNSDLVITLMAAFSEMESANITRNSVHMRYMGFTAKCQNKGRRNPK